ncbi:TPA: hypothetical protein N0F65_007702 [Lagenidium giganteum]|uniref:Kinesin light chain n=1 Tax=Lagenidium giganteum TaxID=4803 RepID=A0AAV2Z5D7_9STRA|nr:TPA: hypothetical protein N0F65_007702 [Lagenidium giganteum]
MRLTLVARVTACITRQPTASAPLLLHAQGHACAGRVGAPVSRVGRFFSTEDSSEPKRPVVQVLHHKHKPSYVEAEQDIALLQRQIRDAYNVGNYSEALETALTCRDAVRDHFGEQHPVYASTIVNIALMYKSLGKMEEAVESYEHALRVYKESVGEQHASFATTLHNLGSVYRTLTHSATGMERVNMLHRAQECFEESLKIRRVMLEPGHPDIALSMCNLGIVHWHNKQADKAFKMLNEAKDLLEQRVGRNSALTALAMNNLAFVYKEARRYDEAIALYTDVVDIRRELLGADHNETIMASHNLAEAYRAAGNEEKAIVIQNELIELLDPKEL